MSESTDAERLIREARVYDPLDLDRWQSEAEYWATLDYWPANGAIGPKTTSGLWHDCTWVVRCIRLIAENRAALAREQALQAIVDKGDPLNWIAGLEDSLKAAIKERDDAQNALVALSEVCIEAGGGLDAIQGIAKLTEENRVLRERIQKLRRHLEGHHFCTNDEMIAADAAKPAGANDDH